MILKRRILRLKNCGLRGREDETAPVTRVHDEFRGKLAENPMASYVFVYERVTERERERERVAKG